MLVLFNYFLQILQLWKSSLMDLCIIEMAIGCWTQLVVWMATGQFSFMKTWLSNLTELLFQLESKALISICTQKWSSV